MKNLFVCGIAAMLTIAVGCGSPTAERSAADYARASFTPLQPAIGGPEIDAPAPEIEGVDLDGQEFKLSDYRGKIIMLSFYANW